MIKKCLYCRKEFTNYPYLLKKQKYCSHSCYGKSKKGQIPWNKGKHWSKEMKKKLSEAHKGQIPVNLESNHKKVTGKGKWLWKGDDVGYRALHYWLNK